MGADLYIVCLIMLNRFEGTDFFFCFFFPPHLSVLSYCAVTVAVICFKLVWCEMLARRDLLFCRLNFCFLDLVYFFELFTPAELAGLKCV